MDIFALTLSEYDNEEWDEVCSSKYNLNHFLSIESALNSLPKDISDTLTVEKNDGNVYYAYTAKRVTMSSRIYRIRDLLIKKIDFHPNTSVFYKGIIMRNSIQLDPIYGNTFKEVEDAYIEKYLVWKQAQSHWKNSKHMKLDMPSISVFEVEAV